MISKQQVSKLRRSDSWLKGWTPVNDSDTAPICYGDYKELLDTLDALWKVAEAAKKYRLLDFARATKRELSDADKAIGEALAAMEEK